MMNEMKMTVWDVGAGNAISLELPNGRLVMVDAGASDTCSPVAILQHKYSTIDTLIITHPHTDHFKDLETIQKLGMMPTVLVRPKHLTDKQIRDDNPNGGTIEDYITMSNGYSRVVECQNDIKNPENTGGVLFQWWTPMAGAASDLNNHSMVVVVTYGKVKIMLPGDCTNAAMEELLGKDDFLTAIKGVNVLVAPHHGHEEGYSTSLMEKISPLVTIVSDDDFEGFSATSNYTNHTRGWDCINGGGVSKNRKTLTTRNDGNIIVATDGAAMSVRYKNAT